MKKIFLILFATFTTLLADNSEKIIADIEREIKATLYLLELDNNDFMKEQTIEEFSLGPINDYNIEQYILSKTTNKRTKKILETIDKYMKKFFPEGKEKFIKKIAIAQIMIESEFNKNAIGDTNTNSPAYGLMQVRLSTASYMQKVMKEFKSDRGMSNIELADYLRTIEGGIKYGMGYLYMKKKYNDYNKTSNKKKFFTMVSLYNGGKNNHRYVNKVFKEINEMDKM